MIMLRDPVGWWCSLGRPLARLPRPGAIAVLIALAAALVWSSFAVTGLADAEAQRIAAVDENAIGDLALYASIVERMEAGETYYAAAMDEQRSNNYPTSPFVTVRLPTLAALDLAIGNSAWQAVSMLVMVGAIMAWLTALVPHASLIERGAACLLIFLCGIGLFDPRALQFHEMVSGMMVTLAMGLYRPGRWWPALIAAGCALALRELALPFVLLWGAFALSQKRWQEAAGVGAVLILFAMGMYLHSLGVAEQRLADDLQSPGWDGMNGPALVLYSMARLSALLYLPMALAGPLALLALLGWIALGGRLGLFASLWFIGYGLAMALFARTNNFYWVLLMLPAYGAGLAFVPRALGDLLRSVKNTKSSTGA